MAKGGAKILFGLFFTIVLAAGLAGGGAWYLTEHRAAGYRSTAVLIVHPAPAADQGASTEGNASSGMATAVYAEIFQSERVARQVYDQLSKKEQANPLEPFESFMGAMKVETTVALQTANQVTYEPIIRLHYTASSPEVAVAVANAWAQSCIEFVAMMDDEQGMALMERSDVAQKMLQDALSQQADLRASGHPDSLEAEAKDSTRAVETLKATIRDLEGIAARDDAALKALKAYVAKAPVAVALELSVKEADAEAALAGANAQRDYAISKLAEVQAAEVEAQKSWASAQPKYEEVQAKVDLLSEQARSLQSEVDKVSRRPKSLSVFSEASTPSAPVGPHRYVIVAGAAILGAVAGLIAYFGLLTMRVYARALDRA